MWLLNDDAATAELMANIAGSAWCSLFIDSIENIIILLFRLLSPELSAAKYLQQHMYLAQQPSKKTPSDNMTTTSLHAFTCNTSNVFKQFLLYNSIK